MNDELRMYISSLLNDDKKINDALDQKMRDDYPLLDPKEFENNEHTESMFFAIRSSYFLSLMNQVLGSQQKID